MRWRCLVSDAGVFGSGSRESEASAVDETAVRRYKNIEWELPEEGIGTWENVQVAVLMDIRDELQALNRILGCQNFLDIPNRLKRIALNTAKPKRKRSQMRRP